jgi:hypothetical protein
MLTQGLGQFGDRRLEKGGSSCMPDWWRAGAPGCGFAGWEAAAPAKFG